MSTESTLVAVRSIISNAAGCGWSCNQKGILDERCDCVAAAERIVALVAPAAAAAEREACAQVAESYWYCTGEAADEYEIGFAEGAEAAAAAIRARAEKPA